MARYEVKVLPWAVTDVRETYLYLLERDDRLAEDFERRVREAILSLADNAHHYQPRADGIRRCPLTRFPQCRESSQ
jgi:plasmid stabilization system protein ParE